MKDPHELEQCRWYLNRPHIVPGAVRYWRWRMAALSLLGGLGR